MRQSKRAKARARQSYVEPDSDDAVEDSGAEPSEDEDVKVSDYEGESGKDLSSDSDPEEASSEDEDKPRKSNPRGRPAKRVDLPLHKKHDGEEGLWKPGAKLEPGTVLIMKNMKPKAREAGDTPYMDDTIHPNTMLFLEDLTRNNERSWLKSHDPDYRNALQDFNTFVEKLSEKVMEADDTIPELPVKDLV